MQHERSYKACGGGCFAAVWRFSERFDAGRLSPVQNGRDDEGLARFRPWITSAHIRLGMTGNRPGVRGPDGALSVPRGECSTATRVLNAPEASPADERRCPPPVRAKGEVGAGHDEAVGAEGDPGSSPG